MPGAGRSAGRASARRASPGARALGAQRKQRLRPSEIRAVTRGRPLRSKRVIVYVAPSPGAPGAAFVAGRRVGGAVERNRARRVLREAWRRILPRLEGDCRAVLIARPEIGGASTDELVEEVAGLLGDAGVMR